jgi:hypothetical protein
VKTETETRTQSQTVLAGSLTREYKLYWWVTRVYCKALCKA